MTDLTPSELAVIRALVELARVTLLAYGDSEEFEGDHGRCHSISGQDFDDVEKALNVLDELPDDKPGYTLAPSGKAEWALRRLLEQAASQSEPLVRYCPGCGSIGPVESKYRDCCPDGNEARMIPEPLAEKCRDTFKIAVEHLVAAQRQEAVPTTQAALSAPDDLPSRLMAAGRRDALTWEDRKAIGEAIGHIEIALIKKATPAAAVSPSEIVKFSDQSTAGPIEKTRRYLKHIADKKPNNPYFFDDGFPRECIADDAAAALAVFEQLAAAPTTQAAPHEDAEASYASMNLAVMVLSDCGHSSNYKPLLDRVAGRIDRHVEQLLNAQRADISAMVDELRELLQDAKRAMTELHQAAIPDESAEGVPAIIPPEAFRRFVDAHAMLCFCLHQRGHNPPQEGQRNG